MQLIFRAHVLFLNLHIGFQLQESRLHLTNLVTWSNGVED